MSMQSVPFRRVNRLFLMLILLEAAVLVGMACVRRVPREHDGFGYFALQYYFLNNAATVGELPQWIPYMMQGTVANWWYGVQGSVFVNSVALIAGPIGALKGLNFLPLFYLGIFFDVLILLVGTWLLAERLFRSAATTFFVCFSVVGPCIWMTQPWYNLRFFYAIPLILALLHRFLDRGSWLSFLFAATLLAQQTVGNLPYYIPVTTLVIGLYFGLYTALNWPEQLAAVRRLRFGLPAILSLLVGLAGLAASFLLLNVGSEQIANYSPGRGADSRVPLDTFLTYGGEITRRKWAEAFLGVSPSLDNTLYMGLLVLPLLVAGSISLKRKCAHLHLLCGLLFLFGLGGFVSVQAYQWWPFMKYFRHIGLTGSLTRVFLCFVAGCGFQAIFLDAEKSRSRRLATGLLAAGLSVLAVGLFYLATDSAAAQRVLLAMHTQTPTSLNAGSSSSYRVISEPAVLRGRLVVSGCLALLGGILLTGRSILSSDKARKLLVAAALVLVAVDVYAYKLGEMWLRTSSLSSGDLGLLAFQEQPYLPRRSRSFYVPNPRVEALQRNFNPRGICQWSTCPFAFVDEVGSTFRVDYWMLPLDQLLRAWRGQDINDRNAPPVGKHQAADLEFPPQEAALQLAGVTADKIQFFRRAHVLSGDAEVAARLSDPHYKGNILFVSSGNQSVPPEESFDSSPRFDVGAGIDVTSPVESDDRVDLEYRVEHFDANNLVLTIRNTTGSSVWLMFSDVWHPGWSATVEGKAAPIYKAALAYKAIKLPPDTSRVHFRFAVRSISSLYFLFGLGSTLWLGILAALVIQTGRTDAGGMCPPAGPTPGL